MFKRKIYDELLKWKKESAGSTALLVEGARRIGKSTIVEEFAKREYKKYLLIDFSLAEQALRDNFDNLGDMNAFFRELFIIVGESLPVRESLIIFDEVQLFPKARQAIKHLVKDGRYDYIETGSLISIKKNVQDILIPSEEECIQMFPMDFEEFLWANGNELYPAIIRDAFNTRKPLGAEAHRKIIKLFRNYMAVGGMPQAVRAFVEGKDFSAIDREKRNILRLYLNDLEKYDNAEGKKAAVVFKSIPEQLSHHNRIFKFSSVDKDARTRNYRNAMEFLDKSMMVNNCVNVTKPELALELYADNSSFKMFMGDTGLLVTHILQNNKEVADKLYRALILDDVGINQGMIFENMTAQMLRSQGYALYFHEYRYSADGNTSEKNYEIDFIIVKDKHLVPIEVKFSNYKSHKSFDYFREKYRLRLQEKYIVYTKDLACEDSLVYMPIYMVMCL